MLSSVLLFVVRLYVNTIPTRPHILPRFTEESFGTSAMGEYLQVIRPEYCAYMAHDSRRFLVHKQMYDLVKGSEDSTVHIEEVRGLGLGLGLG
jgi:hypothetical protein